MVKRALFVSLVAEALTTFAMLLTFRLAAQSWGAEGMSEWVLARRVITLVMPAAVLGLDIALTLAIARASVNSRPVTEYLAGAVPPAAAGAVLIALAMWLIPDALSTLLFGSSDYVYLLVPVAAMVGALVLHVVLFAFLRGTLHFVVGNTLHVVVYGVLPVAAILVLDASPTATLLALAASIGVMVVIFGYRWLRAAARASGVQATSYELLKNGVPRVPAAFGVLALFGLPPITVAHSDSFVSAAFVSLGMSVVTIVGSAFSPLAVVLLPLAARARAARSSSELFAKFAYLIPFAIVVGIVVALVLALGGNLMARALVGHDETVLAHVFRWVGIAAAPYIYFVCARPMVDAHASSFTVTRLVIVAVAVYLAVWILCLQSFGFAALDSALYGHVCSIYALALGTFLEFGRVVRASAAHV